jgi:hypothetical protein
MSSVLFFKNGVYPWFFSMFSPVTTKMVLYEALHIVCIFLKLIEEPTHGLNLM